MSLADAGGWLYQDVWEFSACFLRHTEVNTFTFFSFFMASVYYVVFCELGDISPLVRLLGVIIECPC